MIVENVLGAGRRVAVLIALLCFAIGAGGLGAVAPARAVEPDEILSDSRLEARARALSAELRCLVCQNQSIDDSNAPLARDLRLLVRERIKAGDSNSQVIDFVVARYGEFVLLRPRLGVHTLLLWLAPLLILALAGLYLWRKLSARPSAAEAAGAGAGTAAAPLSPAEQRRLADLIQDNDRAT